MLILVAIVTLSRGDRGVSHDQRDVVDVVPLVEWLPDVINLELRGNKNTD